MDKKIIIEIIKIKLNSFKKIEDEYKSELLLLGVFPDIYKNNNILIRMKVLQLVQKEFTDLLNEIEGLEQTLINN